MVGMRCIEPDVGEPLGAIWLSRVWSRLGSATRQPRAAPKEPLGGTGQPRGAGEPLTNAEVADVYEKYGLLIWKRSRSKLHSEEWADDALQDVFVKVMRHGAGLRAADSKLAWLYTVTDRCCIDLMRRRRRGLAAGDAAAADGVSADAALAGAHAGGCPIEGRNFLSRLLARLGPRERTLAELMFGEGCTQTEAARRLGWSRQTINKKAKLIRQRADEME